jgi:hypothetical protein
MTLIYSAFVGLLIILTILDNKTNKGYNVFKMLHSGCLFCGSRRTTAKEAEERYRSRKEFDFKADVGQKRSSAVSNSSGG